VVSATDPCGRILGFLDRGQKHICINVPSSQTFRCYCENLFSIEISASVVCGHHLMEACVGTIWNALPNSHLQLLTYSRMWI
jgi:hypothetical protein